MARVLMIDNYDSFTFNLVQMLRELGAEVLVYRNDRITPEEALGLGASHLVISPGPGQPRDAGVSIELIKTCSERMKVLGVCLGHQAIAEAFGGVVKRAPRLMHGKASVITHDGAGIFAGVPSPVEVGRYHSLIVDDALPKDLTVSARADTGEVMAIRHGAYRCEGVQFHPESVLTPLGRGLIANFLGEGTR